MSSIQPGLMNQFASGGAFGGSMKRTFVQGLADLGIIPFVQELVANLCCVLTFG